MHWESLNERLEEAFMAGFESGNGFIEIVDKDKRNKIGENSYIEFIRENYKDRNQKDAVYL